VTHSGGLEMQSCSQSLRVAADNKVDSGDMSPFMKNYLKAAIASGELVQIKSKGAVQNFMLD
jgi:hypothetical protein